MAESTRNAKQVRAKLLGRAVRSPVRDRAIKGVMRGLVLAFGLLLSATVGVHADVSPTKPLVELLDQLVEHYGLRLIYSSALVPENLRADAAITYGMDPLRTLQQLLLPFGLTAQQASGETFSVVRLSPARVSVRVLDRQTSQPIEGAVLFVESLRELTGSEGRAVFEVVPAGRLTLAVRARGYQTVVLDSIVVHPKMEPLTIQLETVATFVAEVVVTPGTRSIAVADPSHARTVNLDDTVLVPSLGGDVSRVVETLPGVTAPDNSAAFNLRGSLAEDVSLVLDGFELYEPFHLAAFQSPFSTIDAGIVERIDFLAGGWTSDLGDRHGGFVRLATAEADDARRGELEIGNLNSRFVYRQPLQSIRGGWLASVRTWYPESFGNSIELGESGFSPHFSDTYLKIAGRRGDRSLFSAHGLFASDRIDFLEKDGNEAVAAKSESGYVWFRWLQAGRSDWNLDTVLSIGRVERQRDGLSEPEDDPIQVRDSRRLNLFGLRSDLTKQWSERHLLRMGIDTRWLDARYDYRLSGLESPTEPFRERPSGTSAGAYVAYRTRWSHSLTTEAGLRWDRQSYTSEAQWSPRVNAVWSLDPKTILRLGGGLYHQSQRIHELRIEDGERAFLPAERSRQLELTLRRDLPHGLSVRLDLYDRKLTNVRPRFENLFNPVELFPETESDRLKVAPAFARLRGVELFLQGPQATRWRWWVSYTASSARDEIDGTQVARNWDQPHAGRFLLAYRARERWAVSLSGVGRTGWPTTPASSLVVIEDGAPEAEVVLGPRNSTRFSDYLRLDLRLTRRFEFGAGALRLDLQVRNITDRSNICCVDEADAVLVGPDQAQTILEIRDWLGATPSFGIAWEF